jgi:hypothetical protein
MKNNILESWKKYRQKYREFDPYRDKDILGGKKYGRVGRVPIESLKNNVKNNLKMAVNAISGNYGGPLPPLPTKGQRRKIRLLQSISKKFGGIANLTPAQKNSQLNRDAVTHMGKTIRRGMRLLDYGSNDPRTTHAMRIIAFARDNMPGSKARENRRREQYGQKLDSMALRYYDKLTFGKGNLSHAAPFEERLDAFKPHSQN